MQAMAPRQKSFIKQTDLLRWRGQDPSTVIGDRHVRADRPTLRCERYPVAAVRKGRVGDQQ
jgi:hypothetical protein